MRNASTRAVASWMTSVAARSGQIADSCSGPVSIFAGGSFNTRRAGASGIASITPRNIAHRADFLAIRQALLVTQAIQLRNGLKSYGMIEVLLNGSSTCP